MTAPLPAVLVVEDDEDIRDVLLLHLEFEGLEAASAVDGLDALEKLRAAPVLPEVVLLDVRMPRLNGIELMKIMKADPRLAGIRIVVLTGDTAARQLPEARAASEWFEKPCEIEDVIAAVARLAGEARRSAA